MKASKPQIAVATEQGAPKPELIEGAGNLIYPNTWLKIGLSPGQRRALNKIAAAFIDPKARTPGKAARRVLLAALAHWNAIEDFDLGDQEAAEKAGIFKEVFIERLLNEHFSDHRQKPSATRKKNQPVRFTFEISKAELKHLRWLSRRHFGTKPEDLRSMARWVILLASYHREFISKAFETFIRYHKAEGFTQTSDSQVKCFLGMLRAKGGK